LRRAPERCRAALRVSQPRWCSQATVVAMRKLPVVAVGYRLSRTQWHIAFGGSLLIEPPWAADDGTGVSSLGKVNLFFLLTLMTTLLIDTISREPRFEHAKSTDKLVAGSLLIRAEVRRDPFHCPVFRFLGMDLMVNGIKANSTDVKNWQDEHMTTITSCSPPTFDPLCSAEPEMW
jgi:hypothetical protein